MDVSETSVVVLVSVEFSQTYQTYQLYPLYLLQIIHRLEMLLNFWVLVVEDQVPTKNSFFNL